MEFFDAHTNMWAIDSHLLAFEGKCEHLGKKDGKYYCKIYDKRCDFCRNFNERDCKEVHKIKAIIDVKKLKQKQRR